MQVPCKYLSVMDIIYDLETQYQDAPIPYYILFRALKNLNKTEFESKQVLQELEEMGLIIRLYSVGIKCTR